MENHDHRIIGSKLDLFHIEEHSPGMIFWHPQGWALYRIIEDFIRDKMKEGKFKEVKTPQILSKSLWEKSGHWEKFSHNMFVIKDEDREHAVKPMSCPGHLQIFNNKLRSYRELPLRYAEFGACHRNEASGSLQGLMRTRSFVQDDAHVLCTLDQIEGEVIAFSDLLRDIYKEFGFDSFKVGFSTRPEKRAGEDELWDKAEEMLANAAKVADFEYKLQPGEGAFYGPKLEFILTDLHGREWQCGTIQLDFVLPKRLGAEYVDANGDKVTPIMIHHAVLGSIERFIGILLENTGGKLPNWLAPTQVYIAGVSDDNMEYCLQLKEELEDLGGRIHLDINSDTLSRKIVRWHESMAPALVVIGKKEQENRTANLRFRDSEKGFETSISELKQFVLNGSK